MYSTRPADSMDGTLKYCTNEYADENSSGVVWTTIGYVTGFSVNKNRNERDVYNKRDKVYTSYGRKEYTGSISSLYTLSNEGITKLFTDELPVALKLEIDKGGTGVLCETKYYSNCNFKNYKEDAGNLNEGGGDMTVSCDFSFESDHTVINT